MNDKPTAKYTPGEIVDITIKGVRVQCHTDEDTLEFEYTTELGTVEGVVAVDCANVTVERVAPAEWPPQTGDLWRDQRGNVWFAADLHDIEETDRPEIYMVAAYGDHHVVPDRCNENFGPLTLVRREEADR